MANEIQYVSNYVPPSTSSSSGSSSDDTTEYVSTAVGSNGVTEEQAKDVAEHSDSPGEVITEQLRSGWRWLTGR